MEESKSKQVNIEEVKKDYLLTFKKAIEKMDLDNIVTKKSIKFRKYTKEDVQRFLDNPIGYQNELRDVVEYLMIVSPQFNLLCNYLPNMALFNYQIVPVLESMSALDYVNMKEEYLKVCKYLNKLNISNEFGKALLNNFYFDTFFGYEIESDDNYFIKPLNPKYCRIYGVSSEGCYLVEFDFSYFNGNEKLINGDELKRVAYPSEFKKKYDIFKKKGNDFKWQPLDKGIATKYFEHQLQYSVCPYIGLFNDLMDIEDYKELNKASVESENYKLIALKIPTDGKEEDKFLVSMGIIEQFMAILQEQIPDGVGFFPTPLEPKEITFKKDNLSTRNNVQDATQNLFDATGYSKLMFSGAENSTALSYSVKNDEQKLFHLYRQFENIVNRKLKQEFQGKYKINILNMSKFTEQDTVKILLQSAQASLPVKNRLMASLGINPLEALGMDVLENSVLELYKTWKPLSTSYTQSGDVTAENGRPETDNPTESAISTRENDGNKREKVE